MMSYKVIAVKHPPVKNSGGLESILCRGNLLELFCGPIWGGNCVEEGVDRGTYKSIIGTDNSPTPPVINREKASDSKDDPSISRPNVRGLGCSVIQSSPDLDDLNTSSNDSTDGSSPLVVASRRENSPVPLDLEDHDNEILNAIQKKMPGFTFEHLERANALLKEFKFGNIDRESKHFSQVVRFVSECVTGEVFNFAKEKTESYYKKFIKICSKASDLDMDISKKLKFYHMIIKFFECEQNFQMSYSEDEEQILLDTILKMFSEDNHTKCLVSSYSIMCQDFYKEVKKEAKSRPPFLFYWTRANLQLTLSTEEIPEKEFDAICDVLNWFIALDCAWDDNADGLHDPAIVEAVASIAHKETRRSMKLEEIVFMEDVREINPDWVKIETVLKKKLNSGASHYGTTDANVHHKRRTYAILEFVKKSHWFFHLAAIKLRKLMKPDTYESLTPFLKDTFDSLMNGFLEAVAVNRNPTSEQILLQKNPTASMLIKLYELTKLAILCDKGKVIGASQDGSCKPISFKEFAFIDAFDISNIEHLREHDMFLTDGMTKYINAVTELEIAGRLGNDFATRDRELACGDYSSLNGSLKVLFSYYRSLGLYMQAEALIKVFTAIASKKEAGEEDFTQENNSLEDIFKGNDSVPSVSCLMFDQMQQRLDNAAQMAKDLEEKYGISIINIKGHNMLKLLQFMSRKLI